MLRVSSLFSDGAVLCRRKEIRIFGEAEDGELVTCELLDEKGLPLGRGEARAHRGRFLILLSPQEARTGCRLMISDGKETFCAMDIAVGEVFLAGGQSNMELELQNAQEGPELIRGHVNPLVRYFNVPKYARFCPERDAAWKAARWQAIGPGRGKDMSAVAYFFAMKLQQEVQVPVGIVDSYWGGTSATCWMDEATLRRTGEGARYLQEYQAVGGKVDMETYLEKEKVFQDTLNEWNGRVAKYKEAHPGCPWTEVEQAEGACPWNPPAGPGSPYRPAGLYGTMIEPLLPLSLTGILYYQGETDADLTDQYDVLLMSLIDKWRAAFEGEDLPFLFVQLPMWGENGSSAWPALRMCQSRVRDRMRRTGMICLLDEGEYENLHPTNKRVVGERLYEAARKVVYGREGEASPRVTGRRVEDGMMTLTTDQPLRTRDGKEPALLELAGADGKFVPARAMIEGPVLHLTAAGVEHPLHARYAWVDFGNANLVGPGGLPLEPFEF